MQTLQLGARALLLASLAHTAAGQTCPTPIVLPQDPVASHGAPLTSFEYGSGIVAPVVYSNDEPFLLHGGKNFGLARDAQLRYQVFATDGTAAGTSSHVQLPQDNSNWPEPRNLTSVGNDLYLLVGDGVSVFTYRRLAKITTAGQFEMIDHGPGGAHVSSLVSVGGKLVFTPTADPIGGGIPHVLDAAGVAVPLTAGPCYIDPTSGSGMQPFTLDATGNVAYFYARVGLGLLTVWKTDGTPSGTQQLVAFDALSSGDSWPYGGSSGGMTEWQNHVYFEGWSQAAGFELWRTDGTTAGTGPVGDFAPGAADAAVWLEFATEFGGALHFPMDDGQAGTELWKTDGTAAGTQLVSDLVPGAGGSSPDELVAFGGDLYFVAETPTTGRELFRMDASGVVNLVADIAPGTASGLLAKGNQLRVAQGRLYLAADDGLTGRELWWTNGAGATRLTDFTPPDGDGAPAALTVAPNGDLIFAATSKLYGRELWSTDGSNVALVANFAADASGGPSSPSLAKDILGDALYLRATTSNEGAELRRLDTATGQVALVADMVTDYGAGSFDGVQGILSASLMGPSGARTLFVASTPGTGRELFVTDGTTAGTHLLMDISPGVASSQPLDLVQAGDKVFFTAYLPGTSGRELWVTDGTAAGTHMVVDLTPGTGSGGALYPIALGDRVVFSGFQSGLGVELWISDGTAAGTQLLRDIWPGSTGSDPSRGFRVGDEIYFTASSSSQSTDALWVTDGTTAGTTLVANVQAKPHAPGVDEWCATNGFLYFTAFGAQSGEELFGLDLTTGLARLVADFKPGPSNGAPTHKVAGFNGLYVVATPSASTLSESGLYLLPFGPQGVGAPVEFALSSDLASLHSLVPMGTGVFFTAYTQQAGEELYFADGATGTVTFVCDILPGKLSSSPRNLRAVDGSLYFEAGSELYRLATGQATATVLAVDDALADLRITPPVLGATAQVDLTGAPPAALNLLVMSAPTSQPSALFGTSWSDPLSASLLALIGSAQALPVPANPALAGARLHLQVYSAEPALGTITTSNGVRVQLGN